MGWLECRAMDERVRFIADCLANEETVTVLARRFGVSRKTAHKWIGRYKRDGARGLCERSHAPRHPAGKTAPDIEQVIVGLRKKHPGWGPRKLRGRLVLDEPQVIWPAPSTIGDILKRGGLVRPRRFRRRAPAMTTPFRDAIQPNDVWCIDFKGHWKTGDGTRFEPFTVTDAMSRYLLVCQATKRPNYDNVWPMMKRALHEFGMPGAVRSDNGPPFASTSAGGLSRLSVNFIKMGIMPERIRPGCPQENGRHERMHLTLKREVAVPPSKTARTQGQRMARFQKEFNHERPHEALGQIPPAHVWSPSPRIWDGKLRSPDYWNACQIRRVRQAGTIKWKGRELFVSQVLSGEPVGLFERHNDELELRYGPVVLGHIDANHQIHRQKTTRNRRKNP